jgi:uncharacterized membrane protein
MARPDGVIIYEGIYGSLEDAKMDFEAIKALKHEKLIGEYESALFEKDAEGKVRILETHASARGWGAKAGLVTGAVLGVVLPPSILVMGALGAATGALVGDMTRLFQSVELKDLGDLLEQGSAGVVIVGTTTLEVDVEQVMMRASKVLKQEIDAHAEDLKRYVDDASGAE